MNDGWQWCDEDPLISEFATLCIGVKRKLLMIKIELCIDTACVATAIDSNPTALTCQEYAVESVNNHAGVRRVVA